MAPLTHITPRSSVLARWMILLVAVVMGSSCAPDQMADCRSITLGEPVPERVTAEPRRFYGPGGGGVTDVCWPEHALRVGTVDTDACCSPPEGAHLAAYCNRIRANCSGPADAGATLVHLGTPYSFDYYNLPPGELAVICTIGVRERKVSSVYTTCWRD